MTDPSTYITAEDHLARSVDLLDMALRVTRDQSLPIPERAGEQDVAV